MLGERGGKKIEGFDLGNSPLSVTRKVVNGKRLFMSTTNGTKSLQKVQNANHFFAMGLPNRKAVAEKIISLKSENVLILGSGWERLLFTRGFSGCWCFSLIPKTEL